MSFPEDFVWGAATSSYQIEGAASEGGRKPSIWDDFCNDSGNILDGSNGDVACDHYDRFETDVQMMKDLGLKAYRFSIAWSRILSFGEGGEEEANPKGIEFYNKLIDLLISKDIEPWVTLYHWDLPSHLHKEEGGWTDRRIIERFAAYARICFKHFGDRAKRWITLNEPWVCSVLGYRTGDHAPGHKHPDEPYIAAHHLLLSHAHAVKIYRKEFQSKQGGLIGITNNCDFRFPKNPASSADRAAAQRSVEFCLGWFADPIWGEEGDYPPVMRERLGDRLPHFTTEEKLILKGSADFFGLNHYSTKLASDSEEGEYQNDEGVGLSDDPKWKKTNMGWNVVPEGLRELLKWIKARYNAPTIYITENGCACYEPDHDTAANDVFRRDFLESYIRECRRAIVEGVNLRGYFAWSLLDNFEWAFGYTQRFGICRVDYDTLARTPKLSALWYARTIAQNGANIEQYPGRGK
mmetsp:Transcript_35540/g.53794  ORF Transcript_35540/g.53794 Transcript_35540/m.53794 type:complete len:465 (-) Transcript_35540:120-1514(-)